MPPIRRADGLVEHVLDLLADTPGVQARRMFGGHGIFRDGVMFAIVAGGRLYLKAGPVNAHAFDAFGLAPFTYRRGGRDVALSYRLAPPEALDDAESFRPWAEGAMEAAHAAPR